MRPLLVVEVHPPGDARSSLEQSSTWSYTYEAPEYYLTQANGPWGNLSWSYDDIGNRESETRGGATETYSYVQNAASGNTPILCQGTPTLTTLVNI